MNKIFHKKIKEIDELSKNSQQEYGTFQIPFNNTSIVSSLYKYKIPLNDENNLKDIFNLNNYVDVSKDLFKKDFYIEFSGSEYEKLEKVLEVIPKNIPVVLTNSWLLRDKKLIKTIFNQENIGIKPNENIFSSLDILLHLIENDSIINTEDDYIKIIIDIDDIDILNANINIIKNYFENKYNNVFFEFDININNYKDLERINYLIDNLEENIELNLTFTKEYFLNYNREFLYSKKLNQLLNKFDKKNIIVNYQGISSFGISKIIKFEKQIDVLLSRIPKDAIDIDKVVFIVSFIVNYFSYDYENFNQLKEGTGTIPDRNLFEFLDEKIGVCHDYSVLCEYLLNRVGVKCEYISSESTLIREDGQKDFSHAFNKVFIDDEWYFLDVTWLYEEVCGNPKLNFADSYDFLVSTEEFFKKHKDYPEVLNHKCYTYDREEIEKSLSDVKYWKYNYYISIQGLKDLFNKRKIEQEYKIENAMPGFNIFKGKR